MDKRWGWAKALDFFFFSPFTDSFCSWFVSQRAGWRWLGMRRLDVFSGSPLWTNALFRYLYFCDL